MHVRAELGRGGHIGRPPTGAIVAAVLLLGAGAGVWFIAQRGAQSTSRIPDSIPFDTTTSIVAVLPPVPPVSSASATTDVVPTTAGVAPTPAVTAAPAVTATPPTVAAAPAPVTTVPAPITAALVAVTTLQTVPPVRDLVVEIAGQRYSTDGAGTIAVGDIDPASEVVVIGVLADPPVQQVQFLGWADGLGNAPRALHTLAGPVAELALSLSSRVTVALANGTTGYATVQFDTERGAVGVAVETPTWLVDRRAIRGDGGLTVQQLHYTVNTVVTSAGTEAATAQVFVATPEARWVVITAE